MTRQVAIVTGASQGLGLALSERLSEGGFFVVGVHRGKSASAQWKKLVADRKASEVVGSVGSDEIAKKAFAEAGQAGAIKLVVNCAGVGVFGPVGSYSRADVDEVFEANLIGTIIISEHATKHLRETGGTLVNVMSTAATIGRPNEAIYCASKWGARGYTESLRAELKGTKLRVISVYPGGMKTPFWASKTGRATDSSKFMDPADVADKIIAAINEKPNLYVSDITINRG
jgi:short-subunit dehydrogenase